MQRRGTCFARDGRGWRHESPLLHGEESVAAPDGRRSAARFARWAPTLAAALTAGLACTAQADPPEPARQRELVHLVRQDCGSCHGLTLQGGLGPALLPGALRGKPADSLVATIVGGRAGTPMPPFRGIVGEDEAAWIVEQLMRGFPAAERSAGK